MKKSFIVFVALAVLAITSCHSDGSGKEKSGWTQEIHPFPLDFADQIPYKGYADVRFARGWGNVASDEFWAYLSVWWLTDTASAQVIWIKTDSSDIAAYNALANIYDGNQHVAA